MQVRNLVELRIASSYVRIDVRLDLLELWVGDVRQMARLLTERFALEHAPDASVRELDDDVVTVARGDVRFVIRQGRSATSRVARHVARHGAGVADVALVADDVDRVATRASAAGLSVTGLDDGVRLDLLGDGTIVHSVHSQSSFGAGTELPTIDHVTYCVPCGALDAIAHAYQTAFAMEVVPNDDCAEVGDPARGMRSKVLRSTGSFTIVLTEPRSRDGSGQTEQFLQLRGGAGVQHVAIACEDLLATATALHARGVAFLPVPDEQLERSYMRLRARALPWEALRRHGILVDSDEHGLLFQLFTRPIVESSGFFLEFVQRAGATGFGAANVSALFAAVDAALRDEVS